MPTKLECAVAVKEFMNQMDKEFTIATVDSTTVTVEDIVNFLNKEVESLVKQEATRGKNQEKSRKIKDMILSVLNYNDFMTLPQIMELIPDKEISSGSVSGYLVRLADDHEIEKTKLAKEKRNGYRLRP